MIREVQNELTRMMDEHLRDEDKIEGFNVYIYTDKDGQPETFEDDDEYGWYIRYPGYTCGNVVFDKEKKTVKRIVLTRRGGGFSPGHETVFKNPDKLERLLNTTFKGKTMQVAD